MRSCATFGFNATHVPFKGGPEALTQVANGQVDFMSIGASSGMPFIRSGRLIPLAVSVLLASALARGVICDELRLPPGASSGMTV